jgi:hypothetical protein
MRYRRKVILLLIPVIVTAALTSSLQRFEGLVVLYDSFIYYPLQAARNIIFGFIPFSLGDILYVTAGLWLFIILIQWTYYSVKFRTHKHKLAGSFLNVITVFVFVYLYFVLGWGANYYKQPLRKYWGLANGIQDSLSRDQLRARDSLALVAFNEVLVNNLNNYAPHYRTLSFTEINERAKTYYHLYTDSKVRNNGLQVKPTMFGYFLERVGVEGYYNPFTGEGQVNTSLPAFILPFVISHEQAHQAGIAAEDDANLMAYALGTISDDSAFNYSSYLNIWLYANSRLYRRDSALAKKFEARLNKLTAAHIDTLEQLSRKYQNDVARYSSEMYDSYLKMQQQKQGIRSYGNVAYSAWQLEQKRKLTGKMIISLP